MTLSIFKCSLAALNEIVGPVKLAAEVNQSFGFRNVAVLDHFRRCVPSVNRFRLYHV